MLDLRALVLVSFAATATFACKGAEPAADGGSKKAAPVAKDDAEAKTEDTDAAKAESDGAAEAPEPPETGGGETETGDGETGEAAPVPETFEKIGVDVCDQYVADYVACIDEKVPEAEREAQRRIVFKNLEAWKQTQSSGGPSAAQGLQIGCRAAREQAKRDTQTWACTW